MSNFIKQIQEYYPRYLEAHKKPWTRRFHFMGQIFTIWFTYFIFSESLWFLIPAIPFVIYPWAWSSHFFIEKNKPATFKVNPLLTKACDWVMFYQFIVGKLPS